MDKRIKKWCVIDCSGVLDGRVNWIFFLPHPKSRDANQKNYNIMPDEQLRRATR
jgi:hypothetical protein